MKDKKLLPYIFGLITGVILLPVTDELLNVLYSWIEVMKSAFGIGKMDYMCSLGDDPYVAYNKLRFDALVLNINQYAVPFNSSYTQSSDNTGYRPEIPEEQLSDEGQATRLSGKNEDKGNK